MRRWLTALVVLGLAGAGVAAAAPALAWAKPACLVVDTTSDQSYTSLQDAVAAAAPGDTLFVKQTCTGTTEIGKDLTITGHSNGGQKTATLDGNQQGSVLIIDAGVTVTLNTLVITNGLSSHPGGGTLVFGTVTLNDSTVSNNTAVSGGGIAVTVATLTLNNTTVSNNAAADVGGGIFNNDGTVTLNDSTVSDNTAASFFASAGGICNVNGTLNGAVAAPAPGANVFGNTPDDIASPCG